MKKITLRHNTIKFLKASDRDKNLKSSRKKGRREKIHYIQRNKDKGDSIFLVGNNASGKTVEKRP